MSDLVIRGGTVVDGSGAPARRADVSISGGRIRAVGNLTERGAREIDAGGLVVSPGFIDVHTLVKVEGMSLAAMRTGITWGAPSTAATRSAPIQRFAEDRAIARERRPAGPIINDLD